MFRPAHRSGGTLFAFAVAVAVLTGCVPADAGTLSPTPGGFQAPTGRPSGGPGPSASGRTSTSAPTPRSTGPTATPGPTRPTATPGPMRPTATVLPGRAVTTLATLPVKGRAPRTGYARSVFGQAWADVDHNGCDTRNDVLRRDLAHVALRPGTHGCVVLRGRLSDPYTGRSIAFVRGPGTSSAVQIDHVVALADAWQKGARKWPDSLRLQFANDPLNLLAVDGPTNQRKGDGDAATWLPPLKAERCAYVARQVAVKRRYGLWVTAAERDAMVRVLQTCPVQGLPSR